MKAKTKNLFIIVLLAIALVLGGCATTTQSPSGMTDLQELVSQLQSLSTGAIALKRTAAIAILDGWLFDAGFWGIMIQKGKLRPDPDIVDSINQLTELAKERAGLPNGEELTDLKMGQVLAHYVVIIRGAIKYGIQEVMPQAMQLLALF